MVQHICNTLVRYNALFRKAFQILDYTGMGLLSVEEVWAGRLGRGAIIQEVMAWHEGGC